VDVDGRPYLSASTTLVRLLLNISMHSYTLHCGKVLSILGSRLSTDPFPFHSFRPKKKRKKKRSISCCLSLVKTYIGTVIFTRCSLGTNGQLNHTRSSHRLTLSYRMTRPQQCFQSHNENIPILPLLFLISFLVTQT
jgi:hypothetical protein